MPIATVSATFNAPVERVWGLVTGMDPSWRSDLSSIEVVDDLRFIEETTEGYRTSFTTTARVENERWEFDLVNRHIEGHWTGVFKQEGTGTAAVFTEDVRGRRLFVRPFVRGYLRHQQATYVEDLGRALAAQE